MNVASPDPALSHVVGAGSPALLECTIGEQFDRTAARWGDRDALVVAHQQVRWSWAELKRRVDALAAALLARGLEPGDRIGIWAPNCAEWTLTQFAAARAGLVLVTINPAYRLSELEHALAKVGCRAIVTAPGHRDSDFIAMLDELAPRLPLLGVRIHTGVEERAGFLRLADLAASATPPASPVLSNRDPINIQFTSGTTGSPKGATLTHRNILNNARQVAHRIALGADDRICIPVPLYHCFGMVMGNLAAACTGAAMVYPAESFDPAQTLAAVADERCTALYGVPTMFIAMLEHPQFVGFDLSSLRTGIMAGSPCPEVTMRAVMERMHMREVTIAYGMTETSPVSFQSDIDDPLAERVGTVGRVQPHLEVRIVDPDGHTCPRGVAGELCTRGYAVMQGYWGDADATRAAIDADGWMHSGDLATIDARGYCRITGRIKDMIIRGGENIYPREIEEFLLRHPAIADAQVFGIPDDRYGEQVCAWIIPRSGHALTAEDITGFCSGKIAHFKIPHTVRFVVEFPMTVTGKVQKYLMRETTQAEARS
ncbi:Long-chain-fatty-acid--CoA ligase [Tsuneonella dongtanensis]|uniref:3-methylmercaptopropionyl-CoA ligase n=1 Tax=Tsuneonella dongtanensis TaxID=692370 RepID=A0A1B2ABN8_9SPHN|nr:AMP-binding protein [Tsuneonella dongtanensis]ANY19579.1 Long-chain-fatty-acid--CoA ligase [Tsuneonella dongtanensis]